VDAFWNASRGGAKAEGQPLLILAANSTKVYSVSPTMATPTEYVTLVSSDGFSFVVQRSAAYKSVAIQRMLDPQC
jgi:hypothetical protein